MKNKKLKDLIKRVERLENQKANELEVVSPIVVNKELSIREVQVKVNSQEEANECAKIAEVCGENIGNESNMFYHKSVFYFRKNSMKNYFGVYAFGKSYITISLEEFREHFGKPKKINWTKKQFFYYINDLNPADKIFCITTGQEIKDRAEIIVLTESEDKDRLGQESWVLKSALNLCTESFTLSN